MELEISQWFYFVFISGLLKNAISVFIPDMIKEKNRGGTLHAHGGMGTLCRLSIGQEAIS